MKCVDCGTALRRGKRCHQCSMDIIGEDGMSPNDAKKKEWMVKTAVVCNAAVNMGQTFGQLGLSRHHVFNGFVDAGIAMLLTKVAPEEVAQRLYERADKLVEPATDTQEPTKND